MSLPWLRLYTEFASDPKIQILAFEDQRHFVMLLCLKGNGVLDADAPSDSYRERLIAKALGLDPASAAEAKRRLSEGGLIGADWQPIKWEDRQMVSDNSTERVRKFREKQQRNVSETFQKRPCNGIDKKRLDKIQIQTNTQSARETEIRDWITKIREVYPKAARQDWITAEKLIRNLVNQGEQWSEILAGVRRYRTLCDATNRQAQNPGMFFQAVDRPWTQEWPLPPSKAERRLDANIEVMRQFVGVANG
jgi:hypothetical protein